MSGTVVTVESDATVTLNDLTIENGVGVVSDSDSDGAGGGIYNDGGTVTITDSSITDNMAAAQCCGSGYGGPGGGIETDSGTLTITNTTISDNTGSGGGGVDSDSSIVTIVNSTISGNTAFPYDGGGINNADGVGDGHDSLTITSSTISGNSGYFGGGGIETDNASITSSTISGNKTLDNYGGAGIYADGPLTVTSSTISGNTGSYGGGINFEGESDGVQLGDLRITNSTISGNTANWVGDSGAGGGIYTFGTASITDTTIADNSTNGNSAMSGEGGGGIYGSTTTTVGATIVAGNTGGNCVSPVNNIGYNLTDDATGNACGFTSSTDVVNANPQLGSLAENNGPNEPETMLPSSGSPAVGAIPESTTLNGISVCGSGATDETGSNRPINSSTNCTIGAVEVAATTDTATSIGPTACTANEQIPQSAQVGDSFGDLCASVKDKNGSPVTGASVTFTAPCMGTFANGSTVDTVTSSDGVAESTTFTAGAVAGSYTVTASVPGLSEQADFDLTNTIPAGGSPEDTSISCSAWGWGDDPGNGTSQSSLPVPLTIGDNPNLEPGATVSAVASGSDGANLALSGGEVYAWGDNSYGELELPTHSDKPEVEPPGGVTTTEQSATDGNLCPDTTYTYEVTAVTRFGGETNTGATPDVITPSSSTGSCTDDSGDNNTGIEVKIAWNAAKYCNSGHGCPGGAADDLDSYNIYRQDGGSGDFYEIDNVPATTTSYLDDGGEMLGGEPPCAADTVTCNDTAVTHTTVDTSPHRVKIPGVPGTDAVTAIAEGGTFSLALTAAGDVYAWGENDYGQLGDNTAADGLYGQTSSDLCGGNDPCAASLAASALGNDANTSVDACQNAPVEVNLPLASGETVEAIATEGDVGLALVSCNTNVDPSCTSNTVVYAWGDTTNGAIGNGTEAGGGDACATDCEDEPVEVTGLPSDMTVQDIAGGGDYALALGTEGTTSVVYAWGANASGQLGTGNDNGADTPTEVSGLSGAGTISEISAGYDQSLALTSAGALYAWGDNSDGELDSGSVGGSQHSAGVVATPIANLPAGVTIDDIAAGDLHDLALTSTGALYAWGDDSCGELGDGATVSGTGTPCSDGTGDTVEDPAVAVALPTVGTCPPLPPQTTISVTCIAAGLDSTAITSPAIPLGTAPCAMATPPSTCVTPSQLAAAGVTPYGTSSANSSCTSQSPVDSDDVTKALYDFLNTLPEGTPTSPEEVQFDSDGCYLVNGELYLRDLQDYIFDGNGATFVQTNDSSDKLGPDAKPRAGSSYCQDPDDTGQNSDDTNTKPAGNAYDIMWLFEGGCDIELEDMELTGAYGTSGASGVIQNSAIELAGTQRALINGDDIKDFDGDCVTATGLVEVPAPSNYPSSDTTITGNECAKVGRNNVSITFGNGALLGGEPQVNGSGDLEIPTYTSYCTHPNNPTLADLATDLPPNGGNCFSNPGMNGVDIESDKTNPNDGEGNILIANNVFDNGGKNLIASEAAGQLFNAAIDANTSTTMQSLFAPQPYKADGQKHAALLGTDFTISGNVAACANVGGSGGGTNEDWLLDGEVGGLVSNNTAPMTFDSSLEGGTGQGQSCSAAATGTPVTHFLDTGSADPKNTKKYPMGGDIEVIGNTLDDYTSHGNAPTVLPVHSDNKTASGDTVCGDEDVAGDSLDGNSSAWAFPESSPCATFVPPQPVVASLPDYLTSSQVFTYNGARIRHRSEPASTPTASPAKPEAGSQPGAVKCTKVSGAINFEPPLSDTSEASSEMMLVQETLTGCHGSKGGASPKSGTAVVAVPLPTSNCASLNSGANTPVSLAISWSPSTDGESQVVFSRYAIATSPTPSLTLLGSGTTTHGSYPSGLSIASTGLGMTETQLAADCASSTGLSTTTPTGSVKVGGAPSVSVPGAPTDVAATPGNAQATVTWDAPASDGGLAISSYTVTAADSTTPANGGETCSATTTSCTVFGLTNGNSYTFTVTATNADGTGSPSSPSSSVIPTVLTWSAPSSIDPGYVFTSVSCPSTSFCGAVAYQHGSGNPPSAGNAVFYDGSGWSSPSNPDPGHGFNSISCTSSTFCMAVDDEGDAMIYNGSSWSAPDEVDPGGHSLTSVSCFSPTFCGAVDANAGAVMWDGTTWTTRTSLPPGGLNSIACPSATFCMTVDGTGNVFTYNGSWNTSPDDIDSSAAIISLSCPSPSFCEAVDYDGDGITYTDTNSNPVWSAPVPFDGELTGVSCTSPTFCVAVQAAGFSDGGVYYYDGASPDPWSSSTQIEAIALPDSISCPSQSFCVVVDNEGNVLNGSG